MAKGFLSFAGGLAQGYINETKRRDEMARQDKLDAMREQEFELRKRQLEGQINDQDRARKERDELRDDDQEAKVADGVSVEVDGNLSGNTDAESAANSAAAIATANEQLPPEQRISVGVANTKVVGSGVGQKTFLADANGLEKAQTYASSMNDPQAQAARYANRLRAQGKPTEALKFETEFAATQQALNDARLKAVTNIGLELLGQENYTGFVDAYNKHYNDGRTAVFQPGATGGGAFVIYQGDPKDGKQVGTMNFKDKDDAAKQFYQAMNPVARLQSQMSAEADANKSYELSPGQQRYSGGRLIQENKNLTAAEARLAALERGGSGGSGKPEKPIGPAIETVKTEDGSYLYDKNSGAIGSIIPGSAAVESESSWFGKDKPGAPATPNRVEWRSADGTPLPGGPQTLYSQLPVNKPANKPAAAGVQAAPANAWNDATGEVISNGKVIGKAASKEEARAMLRAKQE